jgi:phosphoribosylformylglycinamidine synthase subunit PurS
VKARITVTLKASVLDPQGKAIEGALAMLGFTGISGVRQGKVFDLDLAESDPARAANLLHDMCEKLLANTVVEDYRIEMV